MYSTNKQNKYNIYRLRLIKIVFYLKSELKIFSINLKDIFLLLPHSTFHSSFNLNWKLSCVAWSDPIYAHSFWLFPVVRAPEPLRPYLSRATSARWAVHSHLTLWMISINFADAAELQLPPRRLRESEKREKTNASYVDN